jgi:hypothetical protein
VTVETELQMKAQLGVIQAEAEAELQGHLRVEAGERMEDWDCPEQCERLEQQLMVQNREVEEESVAQALMVAGEERDQQQEQMGEVEEVPGLMRPEEAAADPKAFEMQEAVVPAEL